MFQLKSLEYDLIKDQVKMIRESSSSQIVMMNFPQNRTDAFLPYSFTEQGIAMLSGILNSDKAEMKKQIGNHDLRISHIFEAIQNLPDENIAKERWEKRKRIGCKND